MSFVHVRRQSQDYYEIILWSYPGELRDYI